MELAGLGHSGIGKKSLHWNMNRYKLIIQSAYIWALQIFTCNGTPNHMPNGMQQTLSLHIEMAEHPLATRCANSQAFWQVHAKLHATMRTKLRAILFCMPNRGKSFPNVMQFCIVLGMHFVSTVSTLWHSLWHALWHSSECQFNIFLSIPFNTSIIVDMMTNILNFYRPNLLNFMLTIFLPTHNHVGKPKTTHAYQ